MPSFSPLPLPIYLLGRPDSGYLIREGKSLLLWTTEAAVVTFIERHAGNMWVPLDYTAVEDSLTLRHVLRRFQQDGFVNAVIDLGDVDREHEQRLAIADLIFPLGAEQSPSLPLQGTPGLRVHIREAERTDAPHSTPRGRVLVVDRSPDLRTLIRHFLDHNGWSADEAETGKMAMQLATASLRANAPYDVILIDMDIGDVDGYATTRQLRSAGWDRPIVALSKSLTLVDDGQRCLLAGCTEVLGTPFTWQELLDCLQRCLYCSPNHLASQAAKTPNEYRMHSCVDGDGNLTQMKSDFVRTLDTFISELVDAINRRDGDRCRNIAETLASTADISGHPRIGNLARITTELIRQGHDQTLTTASLGRLLEACREAVASHSA